MSTEVLSMLVVAVSFIIGVGCWFAAIMLYHLAVFALDDLRVCGFCWPIGIVVIGGILSSAFGVLSGFAFWKFVAMVLIG